MEGVKPRSEGKLQLMEDLFTQVKQARPANAPELKGETQSQVLSFLSDIASKHISEF